MKSQLEELLVTPSCYCTQINELTTTCFGAHWHKNPCQGYPFNEKMKEDHHSFKIPRRCLHIYSVEKVGVFLFWMWSFGNLLLLLAILNLSLKYPRMSSVSLNTECETLQLQNFKSVVSIFGGEREVPKYFYNVGCTLLKHFIEHH